MIEFNRHSDCQLCPLYQSANNPGISTRRWGGGTGKIIENRAILFVGKSPCFKDDKQGESFIGYVGDLLSEMCMAAELKKYADIYLANACRCKPPQGADVSMGQVKICRQHLIEDVAKLKEVYEEVVIVALGAKACCSVLNVTSLSKALKSQGKHSPFFNARVFATYDPAILHPTKKPGLIRAVEVHFSLLIRYLQGVFIPNELLVIPEVGVAVPTKIPAEVSLDIETYGILEGVEQTVFHPIKSKKIDGVEFEKQVVTVSFSWHDEDGKLRSALYVYGNKTHRVLIRRWLRKLSQAGSVCVGQNVKFDLLYLYFAGDAEITYWIDPRRLVVDDTMIWSFLLYEQQPEKGLKELSTLFGITDYSDTLVSCKHSTAKSAWDKDLHYYNCKDSAATLVLKAELIRRIREKYGDDSSKLSDVCSWMRNIAIWDTFDLEKNGSAFDLTKLTEFHNTTEYISTWLNKISEVTYGVKLHGTGSDAPLRQLMLDCLAEADMLSDSRVAWSAKTNKISVGVENVNLVKPYLPNGRNLEVISLFQEYKEQSKIITTYTGPLLKNPRRGIVSRNGTVGLAYPSWYPIPTYSERGGSSDDKAGGQIQGRFSCKGPARQTEPRSIRECSTSRFKGGSLSEYDVNQDHLRMAALLSGDPILMEAYQKEGESIHTRTALTIFPDANPAEVGWKKSDRYKLGKTLNFLVLFRGGAGAFQRTALEDAQVEVELSFCDRAIHAWYAKHHVYKAWQDQMIKLASRQGYLVLPTGWSRTFGIGPENVAGQAGEICNFLHQTPCAQMLQSSHQKVKLQFLKYNLRSVICLQIYDALFVDKYPGEEKNVDEIVGEAMIHPPLLPVLERWTGRTLPWAYEQKDYKI